MLRAREFFFGFGFYPAKALSRKVLNFRPRKIYQLKLRTLASLRLCGKIFFSGFGFISRQGAKAPSYESTLLAAILFDAIVVKCHDK
jgi:hypothetical protein